MDRDDLFSENEIEVDSDDLPDSDFIYVLQVFENSGLIDPHHHCEISELFESKKSFDGEVIYYVRLDGEEEIIGSVTFFYNEWLWRGFADEYRGDIDFRSGLLEVLYSEEEFNSLIVEVGTEHMAAEPESRSVELQIPAEPDADAIQKTLQRIVELSKFFDSRVSKDKGVDSFHTFIDS